MEKERRREYRQRLFFVSLLLAFEDLRSHPGCAAFVVGHVRLDVARRPEVADLEDGASGDQQQTAETAQRKQVSARAFNYQCRNQEIQLN